MNIKSLFLGYLLTIFTSITLLGQTNTVIVQPNIILPSDTIIKNQLLASINDFLSQKNKPNKENTLVQKSGFLETSALLDEMKDIEKITN